MRFLEQGGRKRRWTVTDRSLEFRAARLLVVNVCQPAVLFIWCAPAACSCATSRGHQQHLLRSLRLVIFVSHRQDAEFCRRDFLFASWRLLA